MAKPIKPLLDSLSQIDFFCFFETYTDYKFQHPTFGYENFVVAASPPG
jgi:hypothetical protein